MYLSISIHITDVVIATFPVRWLADMKYNHHRGWICHQVDLELHALRRLRSSDRTFTRGKAIGGGDWFKALLSEPNLETDAFLERLETVVSITLFDIKFRRDAWERAWSVAKYQANNGSVCNDCDAVPSTVVIIRGVYDAYCPLCALCRARGDRKREHAAKIVEAALAMYHLPET